MKAGDLTLGGVLTALTIILLYLTSILTTNTLTLLTLASFMVPVGLMRSGLKTAFMIYVSSSLLSLLIIPLKIALIYTLFFGVYGLIKYFVEKVRNMPLEIVLKLVFFNSIFIVLLTLMQSLLGYSLLNKLQLFISKYVVLKTPHISYLILALCIQLAFFLFDYALTLLIDYYHKYAAKF